MDRRPAATGLRGLPGVRGHPKRDGESERFEIFRTGTTGLVRRGTLTTAPTFRELMVPHPLMYCAPTVLVIMPRRPHGQRLNVWKGEVPVQTPRRLLAGSLDYSGSQPGCPYRVRGVGGAVAEHGPEDVQASSGEREERLDVSFAFGAFAVVVGPGGGQLLSAERADR